MKLSTVLAVLVLLPISHALADGDPHEQGLITASGLGTVDTSKVKNRIQAKLLARRAAIVDAQRNLLETVEGVRVTSGTTVKDAQLESDIVANRVKGLLQGAFTMEESVIEEDGEFLAEVKMGICLNASLKACAARPTLSQVIYGTLPKPTPEETFTAAEAASAYGPVSGLIVDVSELDFVPLFDARLVTTQGKEVYGPGHFDVTMGEDWLHWARSVDAARAKQKVIGSAPLVITATGMASASRVILENEDAVRVFQANLENDGFLKRGKVIFVVR